MNLEVFKGFVFGFRHAFFKGLFGLSELSPFYFASDNGLILKGFFSVYG